MPGVDVGVVVAGWFVSAIFSKLVTVFGDAIKDQLKIHAPTLPKDIDLLVEKAQNVVVSNSELCNWLKELIDTIYEADDLLDEFEYERLQNQVSQSVLSSFYTNNWLSSYRRSERLRNVVEKLNQIVERHRGITNLVNELQVPCFKENNGVVDDYNINESTRFMEPEVKDIFIGRDEEKKQILEILLPSETNSQQDVVISSSHTRLEREIEKGIHSKPIVVLPIVGVGGIGKTTLAQVIYNDPKVDKHFELKAWVYVCEAFDHKLLMLEIIKKFYLYNNKIYQRQTEDNDIDTITARLVDIVSSKKFLLVLDNLSEKIEKQWKHIKTALSQESNGSAILVTTQSVPVAKSISPIEPIRLHTLKEDDYYKLFEHHALGGIDSEKLEVFKFEKYGKIISKKLDGLPLAARAFGKLLNKLDENEWEEISQGEWWANKNVADVILPSLRLSYQYLNTNLKQCFAYCSVFPSNFYFRKDQIVQMWIAQGYIRSCDGRRVEDIGREWFDELTGRSFFQFAGHDIYVIPDLMLNLAKCVSKDECFTIENGSENPPKTVRHLTIRTNYINDNVLKKVYECKQLRTLIVFEDYGYTELGLKLNKLFGKVKNLRVLDLSYSLSEISVEQSAAFGDLVHLRYLNLKGNGMIALGDSICKLFHLQVLNLYGCYGTKSLPKNINNLINLRHLYVNNKLIEKIPSIRKLIDLQELAIFTAQKVKDENRLLELREMNQLHGSLTIAGLETVRNMREALGADMKEKNHLRHLVMRTSSSNPHKAERIFEVLQPHKDLKALEIHGYAGFNHPSWMLQIENLQSICLGNCKNLRKLPQLGKLPYLAYLLLEGLQSITSIGDEFYGNLNRSFPRLEQLQLGSLKILTHWEEWTVLSQSENVYFPRLSKLEIYDCSCLRKLHNLALFPSLKMLRVHDCSSIESDPFLGIKGLTGLTTLEIHNISDAATSLPLSGLTALQNLSLLKCPKLKLLLEWQTLNLRRTTTLECPMVANTDVIQILSTVTDLTMDDTFIFIPVRRFTSLRRLIIKKVNIIEFSEEQEKWFEQIPTLENLQFEDCPHLSQLPKNLSNLSLVKLTINNCISIKSLLATSLPDSLQELELNSCPRLSQLPTSFVHLSSLSKLAIYYCPLIQSLPQSGLPTSLEYLSIGSCRGLEEWYVKVAADWPIKRIKSIRFSLSSISISGNHTCSVAANYDDIEQHYLRAMLLTANYSISYL